MRYFDRFVTSSINPFMTNNIIYGIDVSHNNGTIDWEKVQSADPTNSFAFIKATEGVGYVDPMCLTNATAVSQKTKIRFGYYHFASLNNTTNVSKDASDEANWFVQTMQTMPEASLIPVLDIETNESKLTQQQVQEWISSFMSQMDLLGFPKVIIYSYVSFLNDNLPPNHPFGNFPLWIAHYTSNSSPTIPNGWTSYVAWQYSGSGSVSGVSTQCDLDKADVGLLQLKPVQRPSRSHTKPGLRNTDKTLFSNSSTQSPEPSSQQTQSTGTSASGSSHQRSLLPEKPNTGDNQSPVVVKKGKKKGFVFFGLKLGHWLFIGLMYGSPDRDMSDKEE